MVQPRVVVDVWVLPGDTAPAGHVDHLDPAERARAGALPAAAAGRFVLGRLLLRSVLADRFGCAPHDVVVRASCPRCGGAHGRVTVGRPGAPARPGVEVHVSITRSGPVVAVALCTTGPVGIDAEARSAITAAPLADVVLSPHERDVRRARHGGAALARAWVRKEAALKALGTGLTVEPSSVVLGRPPRRTRGVAAVAGGGVAIADLRLGRGHAGAVAVVAPDLLRAGPAGEEGAVRRLEVRRHDGTSALTGARVSAWPAAGRPPGPA